MSIKANIKLDKTKLKSAIKDQAKKKLESQSLDVECPHCQSTFSAHSGQNTCPHCHNIVNLNLNIKF